MQIANRIQTQNMNTAQLMYASNGQCVHTHTHGVGELCSHTKLGAGVACDVRAECIDIFDKFIIIEMRLVHICVHCIDSNGRIFFFSALSSHMQCNPLA